MSRDLHRTEALAPRPQRLEVVGPAAELQQPPTLRVDPASTIPSSLPRRIEAVFPGGGAPGPWAITLRVEAGERPQGYRLHLDDQGCEVVGGDGAGLFYGVCTLLQLVRLHAPAPGQPLRLPAVHVEDWPDYPHRGVMLDISRDRVPTMKTLYDLVELLASWKINQLQLYMEHTFAYRGHEAVWRDASPLTGEQLRALDAHCRRRHVELVPNQNSFGHMHRWLIHEPYRRLAECPEGIEHPFSPGPEPYGLCPTDPGALELLAELYDQLLPNFTSRQLNVGLDETLDLGRGRSAAACEARGVGRVYLEFLREVHGLVAARGRRMQFWSDIILKHPEQIEALPRDAVALEWGYEADHPFGEHCRRLAAAGLTFHVCPGTSSWNSISGRPGNAVANITRAAEEGRATGAAGLLVTDWGDNGHLQPLPVSYPGLMAAAGRAWNVAELPDLGRALSAHAFDDPAGELGPLVLELGDAHLLTRAPVANGTFLFRLLTRPEPVPPKLRQRLLAGGLCADGLRETAASIDGAMNRLSTTCCQRPDAPLLIEELTWAANMLRMACAVGEVRLEAGLDRPLSAAPAPRRSALRDGLEPLVAMHRRLWLERSRPGGLEDSAARLERVLEVLG